MGVLSFEYQNYYHVQITHMFQYDSKNIKRYSLSYQRNTAPFDLDMFNAPVAITKVAAGAYIYDLFVDKVSYDTIKHDNNIYIDKVKKINAHDSYNINKHKKPISYNVYIDIFKSSHHILIDIWQLYLDRINDNNCSKYYKHEISTYKNFESFYFDGIMTYRYDIKWHIDTITKEQLLSKYNKLFIDRNEESLFKDNSDNGFLFNSLFLARDDQMFLYSDIFSCRYDRLHYLISHELLSFRVNNNKLSYTTNELMSFRFNRIFVTNAIFLAYPYIFKKSFTDLDMSALRVDEAFDIKDCIAKAINNDEAYYFLSNDLCSVDTKSSKFDEVIVTPNENYLKIYNNITIANIYSTLFLNIYENINALKNKYITYINNMHSIFQSDKTVSLNTMQEFLHQDMIANDNMFINIISSDNICNMFCKLPMLKKDYVANVYQLYRISLPSKHIIEYPIERYYENINICNLFSLYSMTVTNKIPVEFPYVQLYKNIYKTITNQCRSLYAKNKDVSKDDNIFDTKTSIEEIRTTQGIFLCKNTNNTGATSYYQIYPLDKKNKHWDIFDHSNAFLNQILKHLMIEYNKFSMMIRKLCPGTVDIGYVSLNVKPKDTITPNIFFLSSDANKLLSIIDIKTIMPSVSSKNLQIIDLRVIYPTLNAKYLDLFDFNLINVDINKKDFTVSDKLVGTIVSKTMDLITILEWTLDKNKKDISFWQDTQIGLTYYKSVTLDDSLIGITKDAHDLNLNLYELNGNKIPHDLYLNTHEFSGDKIPHDLNLNLYELNGGKYKPLHIMMPDILDAYHFHNLSIHSSYQVIHLPHDIYVQNHDVRGIKLQHDMSLVNNMNTGVKIAKHLIVQHFNKGPIWEDIGGFIVPVSKIRKEALIDYIDEFCVKKAHQSLLSSELIGSVLSKKPAMLNESFDLDKEPYNAFIDYNNGFLTKSLVRNAIVGNGIIGLIKEQHKIISNNNLLGIYKLNHEAFIQENNSIGANKSSYQAFIQENNFIGLTKSHHKLMIEETIPFGHEKILQVSIFDDFWVDKLPYLCYYTYGEWVERNVDTNTSIYDSQFKGVVINKEAFLMPNVTLQTRLNLEAWYEYHIFPTRVMYESQLANDLARLDAIKKEVMLPKSDLGKWAWVYESPDPFEGDTFGIDELLLPEIDTKYENFEELIFDREQLRPRNPVREVSENVWIAKYPIRHPSPSHKTYNPDFPFIDYENLGKVYDDSAVRWQNYWGIETSIIHVMFLRYYRIWEVKMFDFATMTMQQSVNKMLDYMYEWIHDYFPLEKLEQAYRVLRLIRWYGEAAIINNSQYIISFEYDALKSDFSTGICNIPSDLREYNPVSNKNDSMITDSKLLCYRNNPAYTNVSDAYIEIMINNNKKTAISFSVINWIGSTYIYLNGRLLGTHTGSHNCITYQIPFTGDTNIFRIERKAIDNKDNEFYIGNIRIENQSFKDLKIDFDPKLRAGNKPIDEIAKKLVAFANLHMEGHRAYETALKNNIGVSEVNNHLIKYWNLHHEHKWKGKRLTIKQV